VVIKFVDELKRSLVDRNIRLTLTEAMVEHLADVGYDLKMGARPLGRKIDELIRVPLSRKILFDRLQDCEITADYRGGTVAFSDLNPIPSTGTVGADGIIQVD